MSPSTLTLNLRRSWRKTKPLWVLLYHCLDITGLTPYSLSSSENTSTNLSNLESGQAPFLVTITKQTHPPARVPQFHDEYSHSSKSTCEEFLQNIIIENLPIEEEESSHPTGTSMRISGPIQANSVLADPSLVATNESYFRKSTGRTEAKFLT